MLRNVKNKIKEFFLLAPQVLVADATTLAANLAGVENFAFQVIMGAAALTGVDKIQLKLTHSDDNITFTDCVAADMYTNVSANIAKELVAAGDANAVHLIEYRGNKQYVKLTLDMQGAMASAAAAVVGLSTFVDAT